MSESYLRLRGLQAPVRLLGEGWEDLDLAQYLPGWPHDILAETQAAPFATLERKDGSYRFTSAFADEPVSHTTLVNTACDMIAHAARQRTREHLDDMCLHAAAVKIGDGLAVFPALRRAGKSTLTAALAARGHAVFSDDVLPLAARFGAPMTGLATGAAIRLRLPLPPGLPDWFHDFVAGCPGPHNRQYQYLTCPEIAENGLALPINALVSLELIDGPGAGIAPMAPAKMLKSLLKQNFAREASAERILMALLTLVRTVPAFHLRYSTLDEAVDLITATLPKRAPEPLTMPEVADRLTPLQDWRGYHAGMALVQRPGATVVDLGQEAFGVSADLGRIVHMDEATLRLWTLLAEGISEEAAIDLLVTAFPQAPEAQIRDDTSRIFRRFRDFGLVQPHDSGTGTQ